MPQTYRALISIMGQCRTREPKKRAARACRAAVLCWIKAVLSVRCHEKRMITIDGLTRLGGTLLRPVLLTFSVIALVVGLVVKWSSFADSQVSADLAWSVGTIPVLLLLAASIIRDLMIGRVGVDAIALLAMTAALALGQSLAAIIVAIMYAGGSVIEAYARGSAERELRVLSDRSPRTATRVGTAGLQTVAASDVAIGDELLVRAGELVPVDGIIFGEGLVDESAVSGEPLPVALGPGDSVQSGTVNAGEPFRMRATAAAASSTYAGIVRMVAAAQTAKAPFMRMADRFAVVLLPLSVGMAGAAWWFSGDPIRGLAVLVVATPCPLILAAPVAFLGGISRAARQGILMKGGAALEAVANVRTVIFDKTGTLTQGGAELIEAEAAPGRNPDDLLFYLASLEQASQHVLSEAILKLARTRGVVLRHPNDVTEKRGSGLNGMIDGRQIRIGSRAFVFNAQRTPLWLDAGERRYARQPVLRVYLAVDGLLAGVFTFGDSLREDAGRALDSLRHLGVEKMMLLTGDDEASAKATVSTLELDEIVANATPEQKLHVVAREMNDESVMMVGDGINDAPALATATVGVALGARGITASSEAADVVLLKPRLTLVPEAIRIAQRTRRIALQSIIAGLVLSAGGMIAAAFGYLEPVAGAILQEAIDVAVILNALRAVTPDDRRSRVFPDELPKPAEKAV